MGTWMAKVKGAQPSAFPSAVVQGGPDLSWRRRSQGLAAKGPLGLCGPATVSPPAVPAEQMGGEVLAAGALRCLRGGEGSLRRLPLTCLPSCATSQGDLGRCGAGAAAAAELLV